MLNLGVTGHRRFAVERQIQSRVETALESLEERFPDQSLTLYSSLAEGADRIVARLVLARSDASLIAVLPMSSQVYMADFVSLDSREEFSQLLAAASAVVQLPLLESRERCYEQAGLYVLDHADMMIAVWDGQPAVGLGGTGQIVGLAVDRRLPVLWIHTEQTMPDEASSSWLTPPERRQEEQ